MRPLASPVLEQRLQGGLELILGLAAGGLAASEGRPASRTAGFVICAAIFGGLMYVLAYRRFLLDAVEAPARAPSTATLERAGTTAKRVAVWTLGPLAALVLLARVTHGGATIPGGIVAGNGAALLVAARWTVAWEKRHELRLLKEPRYRWRRDGGRAGRGLMDSRDFYVAGMQEPAATIGP